MSRYISLHTLACLTRQGAEHLATRLAAADRVTMRLAGQTRKERGVSWKCPSMNSIVCVARSPNGHFGHSIVQLITNDFN